MKNRTCRECKYFAQSEFLDVCTVFCEAHSPDKMCINCDYFKPITNGDRIRALSDEKLAEVFMDLYDGNKCKYCAYNKSGMCSLKPRHEEYDEGGWVEDEDCIRGMIEYLKKEVKDENSK